MNAEVATETDIFSHERARLEEQLHALNGGSTWREPGSHGTRTDKVPYLHTLAAELSFARRCNPNDIGPDIVESLIYRRIVHGVEIRTQLVRALRDMSAKLARADILQLRAAAMAVIVECVSGREAEQPEGVRKEVWIAASALGVRLLWASAGATLRTAGEKRRQGA